MKNHLYHGLAWDPSGFHWTTLENKDGHWSLLQTFKQEWPSPQNDPMACAPFLSDFVRQHRLQGAYVSLAVPRSETMVRWQSSDIQIPMDSLKQTAKDLFPMPMDQLAWTYKRASGDRRTISFFAAILQRTALRYKEALTKAGLQMNGLGIGFWAELLWMQTQEKSLLVEGRVMLVDKTEPAQIIIAQDGFPLLARYLSPTNRSDGFSNEISKTLAYINRTYGEKETTVFDSDLSSGRVRSAGQALCLTRLDTPWLISPRSPESWVRHVLKTYKQPLITTLAAAILLANVAIVRSNKHASNEPNTDQARMKAASNPSLKTVLSALNDIAAALSDGTVLLDLSYDASRRSLLLKGQSKTYADMSNLVFNLTCAKRLTNIQGKEANLRRMGDRELVEFSINAVVRPDESTPLQSLSRPRTINALANRVQAEVSEAAEKSGIRHLYLVGRNENRNVDEITVEWESDQGSSVRFLTDLNDQRKLSDCLKLSLSAHPGKPGLLRGRGVFRFGFSSPTVHVPETMKNIFIAAGKQGHRRSPEDLEGKRLRQELTRKREQERHEKEAQIQQETAALLLKKRELETQLALNGIVNNGREPLAIVNLRNANGRSLMVKNGDTIQEARVTRIDDRKGEVQLDYQGKFQVLLRIQ